jgi:hypothetical protein
MRSVGPVLVSPEVVLLAASAVGLVVLLVVAW